VPDPELQVDACVPGGEIAHPPHAPVVPAPVHEAARAARRFFERRSRVTMRALGSPKTPRTLASGRNPGKAYVSDSRRRCDRSGIPRRCQSRAIRDTPESCYPQGFRRCEAPQITHTIS
jgi:hypothetical protein